MNDVPEEARAQSDIIETGFTASVEGEGPISMTAVAARVNGHPILVGTVLAERRPQLAAIEKQITPQQYPQYRELQLKLLREGLPSHIEQAMIVHAVKLKLTDEILKKVEAQLDEQFDLYVNNLQVKMKAASLAEVEANLQKQGLTLPVMRKMFGDNQLARQFMQTKLGEPPEASRSEILQAYRDREAEFTEPCQVKWQQIQVSFKKFADREDAVDAISKAARDLQSGRSFAEVAKTHSDGPDAAKGGYWDWTQPESLAAELQEPLTGLSPGEPSDIIETATSLQIVQVLERNDARTLAFEEVQERIRKEIIAEKQKAQAQKVLDELRATCVVETMFDDEKQGDPATPAGETARSPRISAFSSEGS